MEADSDAVSVLALGVRGYSSQVFDDPQTAWKLHQETHLIAWRGESEGDLRLDRFDARNLLEERSLFRQLKKRKRKEPETVNQRVKAIVKDAVEDAEETEQQLLHRLRFGDYAVEFPPKEEETFATENKFPYEYSEDESDQESNDEAFKPQWKVPNNLKVPTTKKRHAILEATAKKVRGHPQLEVMLKVKLGENKKFRFLNASHPLHAYYCFLRDENPQSLLLGKKPAVRVSLLGDEYASDSDEDDQSTDEQHKKKTPRYDH